MWLIIAAVLLAGLVAAFVIFRRGRTSKAEEIQNNPETDEDDDEVIANHYRIIKSALQSEGFEDENLARYVTAQAMHESDIFRSPLYLDNNNMFGMRQPVSRPTTSVGKKGGYANYNSVEDSAKDYVLYYRNVGLEQSYPTVKDFVSALKKKAYFEDNLMNYNSAVTKHLAVVNSILNNG